jgi:hypothetical protein
VKRVFILILWLGFVIRLFCFQYTAIINPDGPLYIHQARAIYYGIRDAVIAPDQLSYLSNYPIFIAVSYTIVRDWLIAAKSVSLFFGTLTLIPLYFLLKRFFDDKIGLLVLLIFALIPVFVDRSADVVKGPVFWFFSVLGLCLFVSQFNKRKHFCLLLSSLSFLMATWARVEAILFIIVSCFYILVASQEMKFEKFIVFIIPIVALVMFIAISGLITNMPNVNILRYKKIMFFSGYENLRAGLERLKDQPLGYVTPSYIELVRHLVWFIALGILFTSMVKTFFYPFFLVFIIGLVGIRERVNEDKCIPYFAFSAIGALVILYVLMLGRQTMPTRYLALFVWPSFIFIGFGLEKIIFFLRSRFNLTESVTLSILCLVILACSLPKNLKPRETDKLVFKEIGELIADREGNDREILIATSKQSIRWISFYANLNYKGAPRPKQNYDLENMVGGSYEKFVNNLRARGIRYFLWEEKHWPKQSARYISTQNPRDFVRVGEWSHPDTGKLILFQVI